MSGIDLIASERQRQIHELGWTSDHDDTHTNEELVSAAICYLFEDTTICPWPWPESAWNKDKDTVRNLVKAGALIAAEIDRLQRLRSKAAV